MPDDPTTYFLTQGVLGVTVLVLGIVVRALWQDVKKKEAEKIAILEAWRAETKEEGKAALDVLQGNSQSLFYLADKIESGKKADRGNRR